MVARMNSQYTLSTKLFFLFTFALLFTACTAGDAQFTEQNQAGFFYGLWHGVISFITLIIHLFNNGVMIYETSNTGGWYDFGFLVGVTSI